MFKGGAGQGRAGQGRAQITLEFAFSLFFGCGYKLDARNLPFGSLELVGAHVIRGMVCAAGSLGLACCFLAVSSRSQDDASDDDDWGSIRCCFCRSDCCS